MLKLINLKEINIDISFQKIFEFLYNYICPKDLKVFVENIKNKFKQAKI